MDDIDQLLQFDLIAICIIDKYFIEPWKTGSHSLCPMKNIHLLKLYSLLFYTVIMDQGKGLSPSSDWW